MGNNSRDTFDGLKQYVGVRLQQGVPLVDADWNELEDIRRFELRAYLKWFVGDGVPAGNNGFAIEAIPAVDNDFRIVGGDGTPQGAGRCLVDGLDVFNDNHMRYSQQLLVDTSKATAMGVAPVDLITTPVADTTLRVYLDVWEREIFAGNPGDDQDIFDRNLINEDIGVPTCTRLKREWVVRVTDTGLPPPPVVPGHIYYPLAEISRWAGDAAINPEDIADLRRTGLLVQSQHDINQITQDAFGDGYTLYGDGQANLKLSLRETINSLLRGEMPISQIEPVTVDASKDRFPKSILDQNGNTWWFWSSDRGGARAVWYNRYDITTESWEGETQVAAVSVVNDQFELLEDQSGNIWVFWTSSSSSNHEIWYDRFISASGVWEGNSQLATSTNSAHQPKAMVDQAGDIWVFWESSDSGDTKIWYDRFTVSTASWNGAIPLDIDYPPPTSFNLSSMSVVVDQDDDIWLFWFSGSSGNFDIWSKRYTSATATWGSDIRQTTDAGLDGIPKAIVDAKGRIWLFWLTERSGDREIWYRRYYNESWSSETQLTTSFGQLSSNYGNYGLNIGLNGDLWVSWSSADGGRTDIWYTRYNNDNWDTPRNVTFDFPGTNLIDLYIGNSSDGDIQIFWSGISPRSSNYDAWYRTIVTSI